MNWPLKFKPPGPDWVSTKKQPSGFTQSDHWTRSPQRTKAFLLTCGGQGAAWKIKVFYQEGCYPETAIRIVAFTDSVESYFQNFFNTARRWASLNFGINFFLGGGQNHWIWKELWKMHLRFLVLFPKMVRSIPDVCDVAGWPTHSKVLECRMVPRLLE